MNKKVKRWKKLFLILLVLLLVSQIPFAYRRYRLGRLQNAIQQLNAQRDASLDNHGYNEFVGVMHVHSFLGGHSAGNFDEIIMAAKADKLSFVVMTEHESAHVNTGEMTLKGIHEGVLFVNGNELAQPNADRVLLVPTLAPSDQIITDSANAGYPSNQIGKTLLAGRGKDGLTFVAYPQEFRGWDTTFYDGVEVYNVYTNARQINPVVMFFDALWSYRSYPDLLFANFYQRPTANLDKWDHAIASVKRKLVAVSGNDAHSNVGLSLNDDSGKTLVGLKLDPYERSFRLVRVHVLLPSGVVLRQESLLEALGAGHCFVGFDLFGDTTGFSYTATNGVESKLQGDDIKLSGEVKLKATSPVSARFVLLKDGTIVAGDSGLKSKEYTVKERGVYRVEVYLPQLPGPVKDQPWIISNPIYVK
ncbi:MAG TPA: hypothetical protein VLL54_18915 [Pyrinomonadaceae bacterium]|nr:hypothetical protein [Pyrinomonadaceae bacterium]